VPAAPVRDVPLVPTPAGNADVVLRAGSGGVGSFCVERCRLCHASGASLAVPALRAQYLPTPSPPPLAGCCASRDVSRVPQCSSLTRYGTSGNRLVDYYLPNQLPTRCMSHNAICGTCSNQQVENQLKRLMRNIVSS